MNPKWFALIIFVVLLGSAGCQKEDAGTDVVALAVAEAIGDAITLEATPLADLLAKPEEMLAKVVMVEGTVTGRCQGNGCWISLDSGDPDDPFYAKSADESFIFPEDVIGKKIRVQGEIMSYQPAHDHDHAHAEGEEAHECPPPIYFLNPVGVEVLQ